MRYVNSLFRLCGVAVILLAALHLACSNPSDSQQDNAWRVGPSGGVVEVSDEGNALYGTRVEIPAGALDSTYTITITEEESPSALPTGVTALGPAVSFGPDGLRFDSVMFITLPYDASAADTVQPVVLGYDEVFSRWYFCDLSGIDSAAGRVTAVSSHFSIFQPALLGLGFSVHEDYDTGFRPHIHGFPIDNLHSTCAGMACFSQWYFLNHSDCENLYDIDGELANDIALAAQGRTGKFGAWRKLPWHKFHQHLCAMMDWWSSPVLIGKIWTESGQTYRHALVAYEHDGESISYYNPNRHGEANSLTRSEYENLNGIYTVVHASQLYSAIVYQEHLFEGLYGFELCCGLDVPTNLTSSYIGDDQMAFSWTGDAGAHHYHIRIGTDPNLVDREYGPTNEVCPGTDLLQNPGCIERWADGASFIEQMPYSPVGSRIYFWAVCTVCEYQGDFMRGEWSTVRTFRY